MKVIMKVGQGKRALCSHVDEHNAMLMQEAFQRSQTSNFVLFPVLLFAVRGDRVTGKRSFRIIKT